MNKWLLVAFSAFFCSLNVYAEETVLPTSSNVEEELQNLLLNSAPLDVIKLVPGVYRLSQGISIQTARISLQGAGQNRTILLFDNEGADEHGILINADGVELAHLSIENAPRSALVVQGGVGVKLHDLALKWQSHSKKERVGIVGNSATDLRISDIYISGTVRRGIVLRNTTAAVLSNLNISSTDMAVEIQDSSGLEIRNGEFVDNGTGIGIAQTIDVLPVSVQGTRGIRIVGSKFEDNNRESSRTVNSNNEWPKGAGITLRGTSDVDVFNNSFFRHGSYGVGVMAYINEGETTIYPKHINIADNQFGSSGQFPDAYALGEVMLASGPYLADIFWDGRRSLDELLHLDNKERILALSPLNETTFLNADMSWYQLFSLMHAPTRSIDEYIFEIQRLPPLKLD